MRRWAHSLQRSTWPPNATVRQRSIADMTLSWPRLTWPAWGHAEPARGGGRCPPPRPLAVTTAARQPDGFTSVSNTSRGLVTSPIALMATRV